MGIQFSEAQKQHSDVQSEKEKAMHKNIALCAAIREIAASPTANGYARGYADTYFSLHHEYQGDDLKEAKRIQIKYILSNITHWRGNRHSEIRQLLKEASK
jgi:hypothetical protein